MKLLQLLLAFSALALTGSVTHAQTSSSVYDKTYTWDSCGVQKTSKYSDKATHPAQILALLGNLYVDKEVPGFKQHIEYDTDGNLVEDQVSQKEVNYDMQARMMYLFRYRQNRVVDTLSYEQPHDRASWIAKLPGYGAYTNVPYAYVNDNSSYPAFEELSAADKNRLSKLNRKYYHKKIEAPDEEGATVLFVEVKDSWKDKDIRLFAQTAMGSLPRNVTSSTQDASLRSQQSRTVYGQYFWNYWPTWSLNYWNGEGVTSYGSENSAKTNRYVTQKTGKNYYDFNYDFSKYLYSYDSLFVDRAIESVQLVHNVFRVTDEDNPNNPSPNSGYLCMIDSVKTKRFFYLAKGRVRAGQWFPPFYGAYEQLSPKVPETSKGEWLPRDLDNGKIYDFQHDCRSVLWGDGVTGNAENEENWVYKPHYALNDSIDEATGETYVLRNLTLFIPDKRFSRHSSTDMSNIKNGFVYNMENNAAGQGTTKYTPKMLLYQAELDATATPSSKPGYFDVKLDWLSLFDDSKIHTRIDEQFFVYAVGEDGTIIQLDRYLGDNDNYEQDAPVGEQTREKTYTYRARMQDKSQKYTFIITANPIDPTTQDATKIRVNSNKASVWIPGRDQFALDGSEYCSRYDQATEQNLYRNTLRMKPNAAYENIPTIPEYYELWRKTVGTTDSVLVATVTFAVENDYPRTYSYTVNYKQELPIDVCYDPMPEDFLIYEGTLDITDPDQMNIDLLDYFNVSTAVNDQPAQYCYELHNKSQTLSSANFDVPINKTTQTVSMQPVSLADVEGDTDHTLEQPRVATVTFIGEDNALSTLRRYTLYRINGTSVTQVGKVERKTGTTFNVSQSTNGKTWTPLGPIDLSTSNNISFTEDLNELGLETASYLPVMASMDKGLDNSRVQNTYGCEILDPVMPSFTLAVNAVSQSEYYAEKPLKRAYKARLVLTPDLPDAADVYMFRIWRTLKLNGEPVGTEVLLNTVTPPEVVDPNDKNNLVDRLPTTYPGNGEQVFYDYIIHPELGDDDVLDVEYIARMYTNTQAPEDPSAGAPRRATADPSSDAGKDYFMLNQTGTTSFYNGIVTGVETVTGEPEVTRVVYYNLLGTPSDTPWQGVNVEHRIMSDGTVVTRKVVH